MGSQEATRNICKIEEAFKDISKAFDLSTKLAFSWVSNTNRKTVEQGAKACIELHEDRMARLDEKVKEQENTLIFQGQLVEK